jgi:arylformamidase
MSQQPRVYDISPLVSSRLGVFPGDQTFERQVAMSFSQGHHLTLSQITTTLHIGAHADAPNHYSASGAGIDQVDLLTYIGDCLVLHAQDLQPGERVGHQYFPALDSFKPLPNRVLVRTSSFVNPDRWVSDFNSFAPDFIDELAASGVKLIGIDTPSIDPEDSKKLESHQRVAYHNMAVLEGLVLEHVPEGLYTLIALPLKLENADASPVRAVLLSGAGRI